MYTCIYQANIERVSRLGQSRKKKSCLHGTLKNILYILHGRSNRIFYLLDKDTHIFNSSARTPREYGKQEKMQTGVRTWRKKKYYFIWNKTWRPDATQRLMEDSQDWDRVWFGPQRIPSRRVFGRWDVRVEFVWYLHANGFANLVQERQIVCI